MATVKVRFFATVREVAGTASVEMEATSVGDLLSQLRMRFGPNLARLLDHAVGDPERIVILVNGRNLGRTLKLGQKLSDGDDIAIFPPVSGG